MKTKREETSAGLVEAVCPSKKLDRATVEAQIRHDDRSGTGAAWKNWRVRRNFRRCYTANFRKELPEWVESVSRRGFLQLMGASLAMAGMTGCTKLPLEPIVPYVKQPRTPFRGGRSFTRRP
jgi:molybdopterin-containing oxidoreductase family iron-sulfur binding subunit